jgi:archaellum component FlaG (FlaF/FlaG flagellin family)
MKHSLLSRALLVVVFVVAVLFVVAIALRSTKITNPQASHKERAVQASDVVNETEAFQVVSLSSEITRPEMGQTHYVLTLKNVSSKKITAYVIEQPSGVIQTADSIETGDGISPGSVGRVDIYDTPSPANVAQPNKITIKLAIFEDGSSEGDFAHRKRIMNMRLGTKLQYERINKILQEALKLQQSEFSKSGTNKTGWLELVITDISNLPDQTSPEQNIEVRSGSHYAKESTLNHLKALNEWQAANQSDPINTSLVKKRGGQASPTRRASSVTLGA